MITPSDPEYAATKRIKQGKARLAPPFDELARWIAATWQVTVLNVIYTGRNPLHPPRLQVIVEHRADLLKFVSDLNVDPEKERAVKDRFLQLAGHKSSENFDGLFVWFCAFAPVALIEIDSHVRNAEVDALKARINNPDLWKIYRSFASVTFFFYTDAQVKRYESEGFRPVYSKQYFDLLKPHDEFGYLDEKQFTVLFDSRQNLDENYDSNFFYYDR